MIIDKNIEVKVHHGDRGKYETLLSRELKNGDYIIINQVDVLAGSRFKVECECDHCGETFDRVRSYIKGDTTLCGEGCRVEHLKKNNPNPLKRK